MKIIVNIKTNKANNCVEEINNNEFIVSTTKSPHKGEANGAVVKILAKYFHVAKSDIEIIRGEKTRRKLVEIKY